MRRNNSSPESKSVKFGNEIHGNYKKVGTLIQKQKTQRERITGQERKSQRVKKEEVSEVKDSDRVQCS